jgi:Zn-dependent protease/CBS domain-containing protein
MARRAEERPVVPELTVGEVWGIPIRLHASWLLIFGLVAWSLAGGYFPQAHPDWTPAISWLLGVVTSLLFFASILVHELGHARVARRHGLPIRSITLFVFGGIARIDQEPGGPAVELRIAVAGPATSAALAGLFGAVGLATRDVDVVATPALWLARINALVAVFNLVPGFPLDGGRLLRAFIWWRTGNYEGATRAAAFTGQVVAAGFIAVGLLSVLRGNVIDGVWLALIGWFLQNAASAASQQTSVRRWLRGVTVAQAMTRECARVPGDMLLDKLVHDEVLGAGQRCFLVTEDGRLRGLLTLHEVKAVPRDRWAAVPVEDVMTPREKLRAVAPTDDLLGALTQLDDAGVAQLPVLDGDQLMGTIGREQILHYIRARAELGV